VLVATRIEHFPTLANERGNCSVGIFLRVDSDDSGIENIPLRLTICWKQEELAADADEVKLVTSVHDPPLHGSVFESSRHNIVSNRHEVEVLLSFTVRHPSTLGERLEPS
jgi:hypothetical protein